jgi:hypothetical protein
VPKHEKFYSIIVRSINYVKHTKLLRLESIVIFTDITNWDYISKKRQLNEIKPIRIF